MGQREFEPIRGLGKDTEKLLVQKSRPLLSLCRSELTLAEFKIFDTYLSRIDSHKPEKRAVIFSKGELEHLLGVDRIRTEELDKHLEHLMKTVRVENSSIKRGFSRISLFEKADCIQDEDGLWQVKLKCSRAAMKYIFGIESIGYLRYKLRCVIHLKSRQAYLLFLLLEKNRFRGSPFEIDLEDLKKAIGCEKEESYKDFKRFNSLVLRRISAELIEKTECKFSYTTIKHGRKVTAIRFDLEKKTKIFQELEDIPDQLVISCQDPEKRHIYYLREACDGNFSDDEIAALSSVISLISLPAHKDGCEAAEYMYLRSKYQIMKAQGEKVKHRYYYLLSMIQKDVRSGAVSERKEDPKSGIARHSDLDSWLQKSILENL